MSDIAISVEHLGKKYQIGKQRHASIGDRFRSFWTKSDQIDESEFWALKDVSFEIKKGEAVGIIGKNGAGKSTLLKVLSKITHPTTGRFEMNGRVSSLLEVGTGFHPELTGRENVFLNGTILGMTRSEVKSKFDEIVGFSGVSKFLDTPVKHYSSGMYVRLAFSVAAHLEPEILIIDEVLAVGDAEFQKKCLGKMDEVTKQGRTVVFVSHNMQTMKKLCDRGLVLNEGRNVFIGRVMESIDHYGNLSSHDPVEVDGNGEFVIKSVGFRDPNSFIVIDNPQCGQALTFHIIGQMNDKIGDVECGISFFDKNGNFVSVLNNKMSNYNFDLNSRTVSLYCKMEDFPLMPGNYFCSLTIKANMRKVYNSPKAFTFRVLESDYYHSGYQNTYGRQGVFLQQTWYNEIEKY